MENFGKLIQYNSRGVQPYAFSDLSRDQISPSLGGVDARQIRATKATIGTVILDSSGSMATFTARDGQTCNGQRAVIDCYNSALGDLNEHKTARNAVVIGSFSFKGVVNPWELVENAPRLTSETYVPDGGTPLYDTYNECLRLSLQKQQQILERGIPCNLVFLVVSDAMESDSKHTSLAQVQESTARVLERRDNYIYGVSVGPGARHGLQEMGIGAEWIRDVSDRLGLAAIFREFSMTTAAGGGIARPGAKPPMRRGSQQ